MKWVLFGNWWSFSSTEKEFLWIFISKKKTNWMHWYRTSLYWIRSARKMSPSQLKLSTHPPTPLSRNMTSAMSTLQSFPYQAMLILTFGSEKASWSMAIDFLWLRRKWLYRQLRLYTNSASAKWVSAWTSWVEFNVLKKFHCTSTSQ